MQFIFIKVSVVFENDMSKVAVNEQLDRGITRQKYDRITTRFIKMKKGHQDDGLFHFLFFISLSISI